MFIFFSSYLSQIVVEPHIRSWNVKVHQASTLYTLYSSYLSFHIIARAYKLIIIHDITYMTFDSAHQYGIHICMQWIDARKNYLSNGTNIIIYGEEMTEIESKHC